MRYFRWPVFVLGTLLFVAAAWPQAATTAPADTQSLNFLAVGDWGMPTTNRTKVAEAMAVYATTTRPFDASLMLGDNFYVDLTDSKDPFFKQYFEDTYDAKRLNFPFYALPGNHDYLQKQGFPQRLDIEMDYAKKNPQSRFKMPGRWYRLDFPANSTQPLLTVLMLDSDQELMGPHRWQAELKWLDEELAKPRGVWTMCCAHHPLFSNGHHGDNGVLQRDWGPRFQAAKIDFYLCGHDHTMQHLEIDKWFPSFVISGGGSGALLPMMRDIRGPFSRSSFGFAQMQFDAHQATVRLFDADGQLMHEFTRDKDGKVIVTFNTPSDKATTQRLRALNMSETIPSTMPATVPATTQEDRGN